jgi:hypothetical protein
VETRSGEIDEERLDEVDLRREIRSATSPRIPPPRLTSHSGGVRRGVSKGVEDGRRLRDLWMATPETAVRRFQRWPSPQGAEGSGMVGPKDS